MDPLNKYKSCICKERGLTGPCVFALERIHTMQAEAAVKSKSEPTVGCDWYINSAEHNYSWWLYVKGLDEPVTDKEICQLLGITQQQLTESYNSAIKKLRQARDTPEVQDFIEAVIEYAASRQDDGMELEAPSGDYGVPMFPEEEKTEDDLLAEGFDDKKRKPKKGFGMPIHRDGKKVDLYGLYSRKGREKKDGK